MISFLFPFILGIWITWLWLRDKPQRHERFRCPRCGGFEWGSVAPFETGSCYTCNFKWNRKDDGSYFY